MTSDFDFFKELNKINPAKNVITSTEANSSIETCLISKLPLENNYITLPCSHTFNYNSLYKEIIIQKKKKNHLNTVKLKMGEIKCPYCRTISKKLIPYIPLEGVKKIYGINYPEEYCMDPISCTWKFKSGKRKNTTCNVNGYQSDLGKYCPTHYKYIKNKASQINTSGCSAILKTGKRKGQLCNCKTSSNNLCKRHQNKE